jgi:hypothetical protein
VAAALALGASMIQQAEECSSQRSDLEFEFLGCLKGAIWNLENFSRARRGM